MTAPLPPLSPVETTPALRARVRLLHGRVVDLTFAASRLDIADAPLVALGAAQDEHAAAEAELARREAFADAMGWTRDEAAEIEGILSPGAAS